MFIRTQCGSSVDRERLRRSAWSYPLLVANQSGRRPTCGGIFHAWPVTSGSPRAATKLAAIEKVGRQISAGRSTRAPSFAGLRPASEASSNAKKRNRSSGTRHEVSLGAAIWKLGFRYRKNVRSIKGTPDFVFKSTRIVVFCDGDFWHGRRWVGLRSKLTNGSNGQYWIEKIARNIQRDRDVTRALRRDGWLVLRFWESEIKHDPDGIASRIGNTIRSRKSTGAVPR